MILLDTNILIDLSNSDKEIISLIHKLENKEQFSISTITHMELLIGCRNKIELNKLNNFLAIFDI